MSDILTPTNNLRFIKRKIVVPAIGIGMTDQYRTIQILQQRWEYEDVNYEGEWRDVELVDDANEN